MFDLYENGAKCLRLAARREKSATVSEIHFDPKGRARDGLMLDLKDESGLLWTGVLAFGGTSFDFWTFIPGKPRVCVISHGQGYIVDALCPEKWTAFGPPYLRGALPVQTHECVVAYDDWGLFAIWDLEDVWRYALDADGIFDLRVVGGHIEGKFEHVSAGGGIEPFAIKVTDMKSRGVRPQHP